MATDDKQFENINKELASIGGEAPAQATAEAAKKVGAKPKKKVAKKKPKVVLTHGKRKAAVARARLINGTGRITFNRMDIKTVKPRELRELILEPIRISGAAGEIAKESDISISVRGGGVSGQAQAARTALAKAIAQASSGESIKKLYMEYDRTLLVDDVRQTEPKKFLGPKARARFQKSYR